MREIPIYGDLSLKNRIFAPQTWIRIMKRKLDIGKKRLIGTLLFGEPLTFRMAIGIAICVAAVIFMILKPGKAHSRK